MYEFACSKKKKKKKERGEGGGFDSSLYYVKIYWREYLDQYVSSDDTVNL